MNTKNRHIYILETKEQIVQLSNKKKLISGLFKNLVLEKLFIFQDRLLQNKNSTLSI